MAAVPMMFPAMILGILQLNVHQDTQKRQFVRHLARAMAAQQDDIKVGRFWCGAIAFYFAYRISNPGNYKTWQHKSGSRIVAGSVLHFWLTSIALNN
jgi:hypothetical protein